MSAIESSAGTPTYIRFPITTNVEQLTQDVYSYIKTRSPQWVADDGNLDVWIIQALAALAADLRDLASDVPTDIFRYFGSTLMGLPPIDATQSTVPSTWTMIDSLGHTIPDGTIVGIRNSSGDLIPFATVGNMIIPGGSTVTSAGGLLLRSVNPGANTAGIGGVGVSATLITILDFVSSAVLSGLTTGGIDAESDDDYLNRLSRRMRLLSTRPILPNDFAIMARDVAGVSRVVAVDGYNPTLDTYNNQRVVAVSAIDAAGADVSAPIQATILALLQANRETNFIVYVFGAKRTTIDVTFTAKASPGYVAADVQARAIAAVQAYLNPANWGKVSSDPQDWTDVLWVRFSEIAQVVSNVEGLDYWSALTMRKGAVAFGTTDIALTAPAALAVAGVITGTVT